MSEIRFFIIDDEVDVAETISDALACDFECSSEIYSSLDDALLVLEEQAPDLIICDVFMATGSGLRLTHELEKRAIKIPVIYVTGMMDVLPNADSEIMLRKPIHYPVLKEHITKLLNL